MSSDKYGMRSFIDIVEQADLDDVSLKTILDYFPSAPNDVNRGWLATAINDSAYSEKFLETAGAEIEKIKNELRDWVENPTPLYRGLKEQNPPSENKPVGIHWTNHMITAEDYANGGHILIANIQPNQINWMDTILRRLAWKHEREFSVKPGTPVHAEMVRGFSGRKIGPFSGFA